MIQIALAGNPNAGKTTIFNALTGSSQYVGNWPGVTVEKKEGIYKGESNVKIQDLPGIYSLSPYSPEERVSRTYLSDQKPDAILNVVDATNIERNLYLTSQLLELGIPMVVALNMMDLVRKQKDEINVQKLSQKLGCPVIEVSAIRKEGLNEAMKAAIQVATTDQIPHTAQFSMPVEKAIEQVQNVLPQSNRYIAIKILENDELVQKSLNLSSTQKEKLEAIRSQLEKEMDDDGEGIFTNERYEWITGVLKDCWHKNTTNTLSISERIDQILTNRFLALPIFALIMALVYYISIATVGTWATDWINDVFVDEWAKGGMTTFLESVHASNWIISLVVDGIIGGIGAPLGFLPQMAVIFLALSFLEDCGYMSRIAFIMDRIFRRFGLSGKSFISFMVSTGCGVPGILATRTIEEERDRKMTMIVTTSMPCGAKLPVIALIAGTILGNGDSWWIAWATYMFGIGAIILSALVLKHTKAFEGEVAPFIMELPAYHWPRINNVLRQTWQRCWHFLKKAGTILFACCTVTWFLLSFGLSNEGFGLVETQDSLLAIFSGWISPIFAPLGFGNWQATVAALSGFVAKEQIVSTMGILANVADDSTSNPELLAAMSTMFPSALAAISFLIFNLLDAPCVAAISTLAKEMNSLKWTLFSVGWQMFYAYSVALMVYQLGTWLTTGIFNIGTILALLLLVWYIYQIFKPTLKRKTKLKASSASI